MSGNLKLISSKYNEIRYDKKFRFLNFKNARLTTVCGTFKEHNLCKNALLFQDDNIYDWMWWTQREKLKHDCMSTGFREINQIIENYCSGYVGLFQDIDISKTMFAYEFESTEDFAICKLYMC